MKVPIKIPSTINGNTERFIFPVRLISISSMMQANPLLSIQENNHYCFGTAFDIKEDNISHTIKVTVTRGKVSVANGDKQLGIITPNQQISFNLLNGKATQTQVDAQQAIAWQKNELHFEDITFAEAASQLQQRFNVKINFSNDKVKNCRFTGTALNGEKLDKILR